MSDTNERSVASAGSVAERPLGDPEIAVEILRLRVAELEQAIRRLAEQDATLSVQGGNVIVDIDYTLNDVVPAADGEGIRRPEGSRVRASAPPTGNTQGVLIGGWRTGKPTPQPTLTDAEREILPVISKTIRGRGWRDWSDVIDGLLERLG